MPDLAILVPSRGRPGNLHRLADAVQRTAIMDWRMIVRLDDDDPRAGDYEPLPHVTYIRGPRTRYGASMNELAGVASEAGFPYLALLADDVLPETPGWDALLIESLRSRLGVAYGSDGLEHLHGPDLPTHVVVPTELYNRLGWVVLPALRHLFADNVWRELGKGIGNFQYVPAAKLTHLHPWGGLADRDDTYAEANDKALREVDRLAFEAWKTSGGLYNAIGALTL